MRVAVVGHVEWVEFARVEAVPKPGDIAHALETWEEPAGGGAVAAAQLARLAGSCVLFTAFGSDELGRRSRAGLTALGVDVRAIPETETTRRERPSQANAPRKLDDRGEEWQTGEPFGVELQVAEIEVEHIAAGTQDEFRFIFFKKDIPEFQSYRIRVLESQ